MSQIDPVELPDELITITPTAGGLEFAYQRSPDGTDLLSIMVTDKRVGPVRLVLTSWAARYAVASLGAMVDDLERLRAQWGGHTGERGSQADNGTDADRNDVPPPSAATHGGLTRVGGVVVLSGRTLRTAHDAVKIAARARRLNGLPDSSSYAALGGALAEAMAVAGHSDDRRKVEVEVSGLQPMSVEEAAEQLGKSRRQIRRLAPKLGGHRIGGRWVLDRQAVAEHQEGQEGK